MSDVFLRRVSKSTRVTASDFLCGASGVFGPSLPEIIRSRWSGLAITAMTTII